MIGVVAWRLNVILQRDPQKDKLDFTRLVVIVLLRNGVRSEIARALKSGQQIASKLLDKTSLLIA